MGLSGYRDVQYALNEIDKYFDFIERKLNINKIHTRNITPTLADYDFDICKEEVKRVNVEFELAKYKDINFDNEFKRVKEKYKQDAFIKYFMISNRCFITLIASHYNIDPVAIAGVVAWERAENPSGWLSDYWLQDLQSYTGWMRKFAKFGIGFGSIHLNVAEDIEKRGLILPSNGRHEISKRLRDPVMAIQYIGAIMGHYAKIYEEYAKTNINNLPNILGTLYNIGGDVEEKATTLGNSIDNWEKKERYGNRPKPQPNEMGEWISKHKQDIERILNLEK